MSKSDNGTSAGAPAYMEPFKEHNKPSKEKYLKLTGVEHVLLRPEMYIGSIESSTQYTFVHNEEANQMEWTLISINHGLLKIIDEILLNATDNIQSSTSKPQTYIDVTVDPVTCATCVENDGAGIPIRRHSEHREIYIPEMIFGHLMTGSNFTNTATSETAGRHGYGAKLTNIFSKRFHVRCETSGKSLDIEWRNNMGKVTQLELANLNSTGLEKNKTRISFEPDLKRFGFAKETLPEEMYRVIRTRVMSLAAAFPSVTVRWNGKELIPRLANGSFDFRGYLSMFGKPIVINESQKFRAGLVLVPSKDAGRVARRFLAVVNGVVTHSGGTHVHAVNDCIENGIDAAAAELRNNKGVVVPTSGLHRALVPIVLLNMRDPKFDSQNKARLVTNTTAFARLLPKDMVKSALLEEPWFTSQGTSEASLNAIKLNEDMANVLGTSSENEKRLSKQLALRMSKLVDAPRHSDATEPKTLIVTEGDSAKALVLNSLSTYQRKYCGIFPLRGKLANVRVSPQLLRKSKELLEMFAAIGLKFGKTYKDASELRYQRIVILTDQDVDGAHIRGLLINLFETQWPSLAMLPGFLNIFATPLVRVLTPTSKTLLDFFSMSGYERWRDANPQQTHKCKYYKGLGTFTTAEGKQYFTRLEAAISPLEFGKDCRKLLAKVFSGEEADWRKTWTSTPRACLSGDGDNLLTTTVAGAKINVSHFINTDLWAFAAAGNRRAIPHIIDGLKPSQRKILWALLKRQGNTSMKVAQLSGYVAETSNFHHGEMALQDTMIRMAQDFTGANNINLLVPEGQFGSRIELGHDHAASRYIFTKVSRAARLLFPAADDQCLVHSVDDGVALEPVHYVPIIPMLLCNGSQGIGFGFASNIPSHHPIDVINATRRMIKGEKPRDIIKELVPWAVGFVGSMEALETPGFFLAKGVARIHPATNGSKDRRRIINIAEVPFDMSITRAKEVVLSKIGEENVNGFADYSGGNHADFDITVDDKTIAVLKAGDQGQDLAKVLGLAKLVQVNATVTTRNGGVEQLEDLAPILEHHYEERYATYKKRKSMRLEAIARETKIQEATVAFVDLVVHRKIDLREPLEIQCKNHSLLTEDGKYDYLLNKPISFFTKASLESQKQKLDALREEERKLKATTIEHMWLEELQTLELSITKDLVEREFRILKDTRSSEGLSTPLSRRMAKNDPANEKEKNPPNKRGSSESSSGGGMVIAAQAFVARVEQKALTAAVKFMRRLPRLLLF